MQQLEEAQAAALPFSELLLGSALARGAVLAAFGDAGLGLFLVSDDADAAAAADADAAAALPRVLTAAARLGACISSAAARPALLAAGLGSDVPARAASATATATLQLSWPAGGGLNLRLPPQPPTEAGACGACGARLSTLAADMTAASRRLLAILAAVARCCDAALLGAAAPPGPLEACLLSAGTAKARLIHYRSAAAQLAAAAAATPAAPPAAPSGPPPSPLRALASWQGWHADIGLFTALAAPTLRCGSAAREPCPRCSAGDGGDGGLVVYVRGAPLRVRIPRGCVAVQVGEAAQIMTAGGLRATPHCVTMGGSGGGGSCDAPSELRCRQMMVVFTQPAWGAPLRTPAGGSPGDIAWPPTALDEGKPLVPPLASRLPVAGAEGTYSDFYKATTRAYYGGGGGAGPGTVWASA